MKRPIITLLSVIIINTSYSQEMLKVLKINIVYDGDTFRVSLDCSLPLLCDNIPIRVALVDPPEIRGNCIFEINLAK